MRGAGGGDGEQLIDADGAKDRGINTSPRHPNARKNEHELISNERKIIKID